MTPRLLLSRRAWLLAAGALSLAAGSDALLTGGIRIIRTIVQRAVGPVSMSGADWRAFEAGALANVQAQGASASSIIMLSLAYGPIRLLGHWLPAAQRFKVEQFERQVLTFFLLTTDYLEQRHTPGAIVTFLGEPPACANPWARFD